jgi:hypothetical protein
MEVHSKLKFTETPRISTVCSLRSLNCTRNMDWFIVLNRFYACNIIHHPQGNLHAAVTRRANGWNLEIFQKVSFLRGNRGPFDRQSISLYIFGLRMVNPQSDNEMQNTKFCEQNVRSIFIYGGTRNFENVTLNISVITIQRNVKSYATQDYTSFRNPQC